MRKIKSKKGFTLAELLVVVAIIGVLVAISVPIFNGKLEKARIATNQANLRSAKAAAVAEYLQADDEDKKAEGVTIILDVKAGTTISSLDKDSDGKLIKLTELKNDPKRMGNSSDNDGDVTKCTEDKVIYDKIQCNVKGTDNSQYTFTFKVDKEPSPEN